MSAAQGELGAPNLATALAEQVTPTGWSYSAHVGTSYVEYRGRGFWTRDAALETILGLLVVDLQPLSADDEALSAVLDSWPLQATIGMNGCVSADLDENLANPSVRSLVLAGLRRIIAGLPADGLVKPASQEFNERAARTTEGSWRCPYALATWVTEVGKALLDLIEGKLPATLDDFWWVDALGRSKLPRIRRDT